MSLTDGVNGKGRLARWASRQSRMDSTDPRGAGGFAAMCAQAASLTCSSDRPAGPPRHFCGAATTRSACQAVTSQRIPPKVETASTISSAPCAATTAAIASRSLTVPAGVSQCTTLTMPMSGRARSASATLAAGTALS